MSGSLATQTHDEREGILAMLEGIYGDGRSEHLKMPFVPHIDVMLAVARTFADRLAGADYVKLTNLILFHDLVMVFPDFAFPPVVNAALATVGLEVTELRIVSFKHLRDEYGHDDWSAIVPRYVANLLAFNSEVCLIHALICWSSHIIFCVKHGDRHYVDNLAIMYREFDAKLPNAAPGFQYEDVIRTMLARYDLELQTADRALDDSCGFRA